jgi:lipopolysaccharide export LptBFGC system permease protein LptF
MMKIKIVGYYSIFIGIAVIAMWTIILFTQYPPEGKTELTFHLISEFIMAFLCLLSGILILRNKSIGKHLSILGFGMIIYSVLNASGYYGENNEVPMMLMFIALSILTSIAVIVNLKSILTTKT